MSAPILTDTSRDGLLAAIEADIVATRLTNVDVPVEPHVDPDVAWAIARDAGARRTVVVRAAFDEGSADRRIADILAVADSGGTSAGWWLAPHHRPADLRERLIRFGFVDEGTNAAMTLDLATLPAVLAPPPPGLAIAPVSDLDGVRAFVAVHMADRPEGTGSVRPGAGDLRMRHIAGKLGDGHSGVRLVGMVDGVPVATSRLSTSGGVAGLYGIVTIPHARGQGYGRAMTLAALDAGRRLGLRIAALQATDLGYPVYRRIGFEEQFRYTLLVRPA